MKIHTIYLIHADQDERVGGFKEQLAAEAEALRLDPGGHYEIRELPGATIEHEVEWEQPLAFGLYFASAAGRDSTECGTSISALLQGKVPVVPVLAEGEHFNAVTPAALSPINALFHEAGEFAAVSNLVLRTIGLTEQQRRVFVSYRRSEALHMGEELWETLGKFGFDVFMDRFSIEPGANFQRKLESRLREKAFVLLIESPNLQSSQWVMHEVSFAQKNRLGILALTWDETRKAGKLLENLLSETRHSLTAADYSVADGQGRFSSAFLKALPPKIEQAHGKAMRERRGQLLGSVRKELERRSLAYIPLSAWTVLVKIPAQDSTPSRRVAISITPRPPEIPDLFVLDSFFTRSGQAYHAAYLVHAATQDEEALEQLHWAIGPRTIELINEDSIVSLVAAL